MSLLELHSHGGPESPGSPPAEAVPLDQRGLQIVGIRTWDPPLRGAGDPDSLEDGINR